MRIVILGNSGSGKSTLAQALAARHELALLDLDVIAFTDTPGERKSLTASESDLRAFVDAHPTWVIEGSYADLAELALPFCSELRFLNPGVAACLANCDARPFEPHKYDSPEAQNANLEMLKDWVRQYDSRDDEYGLAQHRRVFDSFNGKKREFTGLDEYDDPF